MAIARTGVFVDDYLEYSSTLPAELQRLLNTIRELDDRSQAMIGQTRQQTKYCLGLASQGGSFSRRNEDEEVSEKLRKEIEANQDNALSLCTEKVLLARQAHDLIDSHIKRLDEDLNNFADDLKQEGKIAPDEPAVLPPLPLVPKGEKRKPLYGTPQSKRLDYKERDWDRERDRDFELMPPPGSLKKDFVSPVELDQPIDPNEPTYCVCHQVSFGDMIACDNENCQGGEWFHYACVGLTPETRFKGKWYCPTCRQGIINVGDEGGFAPNVQDSQEGLVLLMDAIEKARTKLGMDVAASEFLTKERKYGLNFKKHPNYGAHVLAVEKLGDLYKNLGEFPIVSLEDPFDQDD